MVEEDKEISAAVEDEQDAKSPDDIKIRKLEDEEDEIDKKIDELLSKRKLLMGKLAKLVADENRHKMVDSGVQTATDLMDEFEELDVAAAQSVRSETCAAQTDTGDTQDANAGHGSHPSLDRKKRKKTLYESLKKALTKAAQHIKSKTRRSRELQPDVTVDVGIRQDFGQERRTSTASNKESDQSGEAGNADLTQELAQLDALAGMALEQRPESEDFVQQAEENETPSLADEIMELHAMTERTLDAAQPALTTEPNGTEDDQEAAQEEEEGPLASELRGMLDQISNIAPAPEAESIASEAIPESTGDHTWQGLDPIPPIPAIEPEAGDDDDDVEESNASMLQSQLQDMLSQIGQIGAGLTVTGAGEC